ncbi:MFS general substrate transporter, partial [Caulochytrium protostelioides]
DPGGVAGVDDQIGYYAGLLGSCFYAPLFVMNIAWGLASDRVGRKPVLLLGVLVGGCASLMLSLSSHFWVPFAARLLAGLFGANSTVTKGHLGALMPDEVERSWAYGIYGSVYGIMGIVGPLLGSLLTDPARRYPGAVAADGFLAHHPFFLPIITTTALHVAGFVLITRRFEGPKLASALARPPPTSPQATLRAIREDHSPAGARASRGGLSWATVRAALTPAVLRAIGLYCSIALVNMLWTIILPLYFSTAAVDGGLGLRASQASLPLAALMAAKFLVQFFGSVHIVAPLGSRATFIVGMLLVGPVLLALGLLHTLPAGAGRWLALLSCMMLLGVAEAMCYLSVILQITMSVPSASQLGLVHGIATSAAAMVRTIAPAAGGAMW